VHCNIHIISRSIFNCYEESSKNNSNNNKKKSRLEKKLKIKREQIFEVIMRSVQVDDDKNDNII
jgi:hypothetical protein